VTVAFPDDDGLMSVLSALGVSPQDHLGHGGEAWVYALDDDHVVRVLHEGQNGETIARRQTLIDELRSAHAPFGLPEVLSIGERDGRWFAVERRLPGIPVMAGLDQLEGSERDLLVERHLEAAAVLGSLPLEPRGWFGELITEHPVRSPTWRGFLCDRAAASLRRSTFRVPGLDPARLAGELPDTTDPAFVHLDAFAGNMLAVGATITAVLDVGPTALSGDARLDPVAAAAYLSAPQITPVATRRDVDVAMSWLRSAGLAEWFVPATRWLAAFWSFAVDDHRLHEWCRAVLLPA
jgi:hypothetical protein